MILECNTWASKSCSQWSSRRHRLEIWNSNDFIKFSSFITRSIISTDLDEDCWVALRKQRTYGLLGRIIEPKLPTIREQEMEMIMTVKMLCWWVYFIDYSIIRDEANISGVPFSRVFRSSSRDCYLWHGGDFYFQACLALLSMYGMMPY